MNQFSVIVPYSGSLAAFEDTLASVLRHRPDRSQIIVPHDGTYNDPYGLQGEVDYVTSDQCSNLIQLLNLAMPSVAGDWTVLIRPGVELDENWQASLQSVIGDPDVGSVVPILIRCDRPRRMVSAGIRTDRTCTRQICGVGQYCSSLVAENWNAIGPSSWLAVYRSSVLRAIGPFDERLDSVYIDVDIALAISQLGLRTCVDPGFVATLDSDADILAEMKHPHGLSAQRAFQRFARTGNSNSLGNCLAELLQLPLRPWKLNHLWQRLGARKTQRLDDDFVRRLDLAAAEKCWLTDDMDSKTRAAVRHRAA